MNGQVPHTAEDATPSELRRASLRLLLMLLALALLVTPIIRDLPLGKSTRAGLLAWLLVGLALYWLYEGMGYRPLLLLQLFIFSTGNFRQVDGVTTGICLKCLTPEED